MIDKINAKIDELTFFVNSIAREVESEADKDYPDQSYLSHLNKLKDKVSSDIQLLTDILN